MKTRLKKVLLTILSLNAYLNLSSQTPGEWTWMAGSNSNATPVYGVQGMPDLANTPGGNYEGAKWTDNNGDLWFYSGQQVSGISSVIYDQNLWKYDISSNMWTWMHGPGLLSTGNAIYGNQGIPSANVLPHSSGLGQHAEWVDSNGKLWLLTVSSMLDTTSLWKYDPLINQWAWIHGDIQFNSGVQGIPDPLNNPFTYECPVSWIDGTDDLWLWNSVSSELWKYNISLNMWTWMKGSFSFFDIYGSVGVYNTSNQPASQASGFYEFWKSDDGTFYTLGENKMWQFNPLINQWRVVHEGNGNTAVFNGNCSFDTVNCPSSYAEQRCSWKDDCNRFYGLDKDLGGYIYCFDPVINQYALIDGSVQLSGANIPPVFGVQGVSSPIVFPGTNSVWAGISVGSGNASWTDNDGNFWMLGTALDPSLVFSNETNSLFRYVPDLSCLGGNISANFTSLPQQGCFPLQVEFLPQDTSSTISFHWNFGDPSTLSDTSNSNNPNYTYNNPGVYTVELIVNGSGFCGSGSDTSEIIVTVVAPPVLNLSSDTSVCSGSSVPLSVSGATSYSWSPSVSLNTTVGANVNASPTITTEYFVTGTTSGCSSSDSVIVIVHPIPQIQINDTLICKGDTVSLFVSGAQTYTWFPPTGLSTTTGANVQAFPSITSTYTITGIDSNSCIGTKNVLVSVESITVNVNSDTICKNEINPLVTLSASGAQTYSWSPATGLSSSTGNSVVCTANATTNYSVIGVSANGCLDTGIALVTVVPYFNVIVPSDSICLGETSLLTANGANSYLWSTTQGVNLSSGSEISLSPTTTTEYKILGKVLNCVDTAYASITVFPIPSANIIAYPNPVSSTDPVVNLSTNSQGNTIKWLIGGDLVSNISSFTHDFENAEPGNYVVQLVLENLLGCIDTISLTIIIEEDILFYIPNSFTPNSDEFNTVFTPIISSGIASTGYEFIVINRWGETVFESKDISLGWDGTYKGEICQDGTYVWRVAFNSKYNSRRYEYTGHLNLLK